MSDTVRDHNDAVRAWLDDAPASAAPPAALEEKRKAPLGRDAASNALRAVRDARILEVARRGGTQAEVLAALLPEFPALKFATVRNVIHKARGTGALPRLSAEDRRRIRSAVGTRVGALTSAGYRPRHDAVVAMFRQGGRSYAEIAEALNGDFPELDARGVRAAVKWARAHGVLPPAPLVSLTPKPAAAIPKVKAAPEKTRAAAKIAPPKRPAADGEIGPKGLDERALKAIALVRDGMSYGQVVAALRMRWPATTRNTVAGIVERARKRGLLPPGPGTPTGGWHASARERKPRAARPKRTGVAALPAATPVARKPPTPVARPDPALFVLPPLPDVPVDAEGRERRRIAFDAMTESRGCKFPIGDPRAPGFRFCCAARSGTGPYCDHHHAVAYQPLTAWTRDNNAAIGKRLLPPRMLEAAE